MNNKKCIDESEKEAKRNIYNTKRRIKRKNRTPLQVEADNEKQKIYDRNRKLKQAYEKATANHGKSFNTMKTQTVVAMNELVQDCIVQDTPQVNHDLIVEASLKPDDGDSDSDIEEVDIFPTDSDECDNEMETINDGIQNIHIEEQIVCMEINQDSEFAYESVQDEMQGLQDDQQIGIVGFDDESEFAEDHYYEDLIDVQEPAMEENVNDPEYPVERIIAREADPVLMTNNYFLKWEGYNESESSWQPEWNMTADLVAEQYAIGESKYFKKRSFIYIVKFRIAVEDTERPGLLDGGIEVDADEEYVQVKFIVPCPICKETMSRRKCAVPSCGHPAHLSCMQEHIKSSIKCVMCRKQMNLLDEPSTNLKKRLKKTKKLAKPKRCLLYRIIFMP